PPSSLQRLEWLPEQGESEKQRLRAVSGLDIAAPPADPGEQEKPRRRKPTVPEELVALLRDSDVAREIVAELRKEPKTAQGLLTATGRKHLATIYRTLSELKKVGAVEHEGKGEPYKLTALGRACNRRAQ